MIDAIVYDMGSPREVQAQSMRRTSFTCGGTFGPIFVTEGEGKFNTLQSIADAPESIFVNVKLGFTLKYLHDHSLLEFRAFTSTKACLDV